MKKTIIGVSIGLIIIILIIVFGQVFKINYIDVDFENNVTECDQSDIVTYADISINTNIFVINEKEIKAKVEKKFSNNAIKVTDIVRVFPNKITIHIRENIPIFKIKTEISRNNTVINGFVTPDVNFQRTTVYSESTVINKKLVDVNNLVINNSFNIKGCVLLQKIAKVLMESEVKEEAIPYLINSIEFTDNFIKIIFEGTNAIIRIANSDKETVYNEFKEKYKAYESLSLREKIGKTII